MELSERIIQTLESEGFIAVYEESIKPLSESPSLSSLSSVTLVVTDGLIKVTTPYSTITLAVGKRLDIPAGDIYSIKGGLEGANFVIGEK